MQVYILDKDFQTIGAIKVFNSLIWTRRYYETGVFEFHTSSSFFPLFNSGKYICRNDRAELGVIREVNYAQTDKGERSAYCKGYFAEKLLDDRVLQAPINISGRNRTCSCRWDVHTSGKPWASYSTASPWESQRAWDKNYIADHRR